MSRVVWLLVSFALPLAVANAQRLDASVQLKVSHDATVSLASHEYRAQTSGTLFVWAEAELCDLVLRVERPDGSLLAEDDNSGGATTPWVIAEVEANDHLILRVVSRTRDVGCDATLRVRELPTTPELVAAVAEGQRELSTASTEASAGDLTRAVVRANSAFERLVGTEGARNCYAAHRMLANFGVQAAQWDDRELHHRTFELLHEWTRENYPPLSETWLFVVYEYAAALTERGRSVESLPLMQSAVAGFERTLASDDPWLTVARFAVAQVYWGSRELEQAETLMRHALERGRHLESAADVRFSIMEGMYGTVLQELGYLDEARRVQERSHAALARVLDELDPQLLASENNLAATLSAIGDKKAALAVHRGVLAKLERRGLPGDREVWNSKYNVAVCMQATGAYEEALPMFEELMVAYSELHAPESGARELLDAAIAHVLVRLGDSTRALAILEQRRQIRREAEHVDPLGTWRLELSSANALASLERREEALECARRALVAAQRAFPADNPDLAETREQVATLLLAVGRPESAFGLARDAANEARAYLERSGATLSMRAAEAVQSHWSRIVSDGVDLLDATAMDAEREVSNELAFELIETARGVGTAMLRFARAPRGVHEALDTRRASVARAVRELAALAADPGATLAALDAALSAKERAESELRESIALHRGSTVGRSAAQLRAQLRPNEAAIGWWRLDVKPMGAPLSAPREARLIAFVLRHGSPIARFDLGPLAPIRAAAEGWLTALDENARNEAESGALLRTLVFDPLMKTLAGSDTWYVAPDDVLHLVPLDALALETERIGDRARVVVRPSLLRESEAHPATSSPDVLVVLGGVDYEFVEPESTEIDASQTADEMRSGDFEPLWETQAEIEEVARVFRASHAEPARVEPLEEREATKAALTASVGSARFLHIATHGFFTRKPVSAVGVALAERSPLVLCGLALSGANADANGIITAEELAALDLSRCELVVLSACDTNVGRLDAGQGIASFQKALHAAGARYAVTSLWKVADKQAGELMRDFYRALWVDRLTPERALWRAKQAMRARRAPPRDWAGWVLSGQ